MNNVNWKKLQNGSDIRGVALEGIADEPVNLTPEIAETLGKAFASWLTQKAAKPASELTVSVGRDSRLSGPTLIQSVMDGIIATGCRVYNFEIASTPAMFMSTVTSGFDCDGAIMLTASHLPFNRNGFKFFTPQGGLESQDITDILTLAEKDDFETASITGSIEKHDFISVYSDRLVAKIREAVNHPDNFEQPLKGLKIVVDAGNGAGGFYVDKVLKPLGADTTGSQFLDPDGTFPNHVPNPEDKEAMAAICQAVLDNKSDFGIIFDTDVDRVAAVDHLGKEINRNRMIALISAIVLQEHPSSTVVTDSITSDGLKQFIEQNLRGVHHRFKRGYKNIINEAMRLNQEGQESWLAIETSGHGAMKENYFLDDGAYLATKLLIELARLKLEGKLLTDLIADLQEPQESEEFRLKIKVDDFQSYGNTVIEQLKEFASTQAGWEIIPNNYEGVRISCQSPEENGWLLLRLSLHDPVIPLNIESNVSGGVSKIVARLIDFFQPFESLDLSALLSYSMNFVSRRAVRPRVAPKAQGNADRAETQRDK
jgi:phosphomannomutase